MGNTLQDLQILSEAITSDCLVPGNTTQTGSNFCEWVLTNLYDLTQDEAFAALCGGSADAGIDAFFTLHGAAYFVQTKYSSADPWGDVVRLREDVRLVESRTLSEKEKARLAWVLESFDVFRAEYPEAPIRKCYITASSSSDTVRRKMAQLEDKSLTFLDLTGLAETLQDKAANISPRWKGHAITIDLGQQFASSDTLICELPASSVAKLAREANDYLFASNVRQFLKASKINKKMAETLRTSPSNFWLFNNGITMVCDDYSINGCELSITTPQVVNGCQTVTTIRDVGAMDGADGLANAKVLARIFKSLGPELRKNVTKYTNAQNAVRGKDYYALSDLQQKVKKDIEPFGYFYEIQRGSGAHLAKKKLLEYSGSAQFAHLDPPKWNHFIPAIESAQALAATVLLKPEIAYSRSEDLTPLGQYYDELFPQDMSMDSRMFFLPFLVVQYARKFKRYGRGAQGWRRSAQFLYATTFHKLLIGGQAFAYTDKMDAITSKAMADAYQRLLSDRDRSERALDIVDDILDRFFTDSKIESLLLDFNGDEKNLMKRKLLGSEWDPILSKYVTLAVAKHPTILSFV